LISTSGNRGELTDRGAKSSRTARNDMAFRLGGYNENKRSVRRRISRHAKTEDKKLRKELALEVLALKVPFRNLPVFPNQVPWPGRLENSTSSECFDAGRTREIQQIRPAATHLLSVNCLYQMNPEKRKGEFKK
jgi:hypothetical protein